MTRVFSVTLWLIVASITDHQNKYCVYGRSIDEAENTNEDDAADFHRMSDPSTYPSAPSKPIGMNVTTDSVHLHWEPPKKQGASAITGYIVQYYSPEQGQTWFNVPDEIQKPSYRVENLRPASSYIFLIRAENREGIGEPSAMSAVVRTKGTSGIADNTESELELARQRLAHSSKRLVKLVDVKALNSTSVRLYWQSEHHQLLIEGFIVHWQDRQKSGSPKSINIPGAEKRTQTVTGLRPHSIYTFYITPYYRTIQGMPSNSLQVRTYEARPIAVPEDVRLRLVNLTTLHVSWNPPKDNKMMNGVLTGYNLAVIGNCSSCYRNISTNDRAGSITLFRLHPGTSYIIKLAARNRAGIGRYHKSLPLTMDNETLELHKKQALKDKKRGNKSGHQEGSNKIQMEEIVTSPWFIAAMGVTVWIALLCLTVTVWCCFCKKRNRKSDKQQKQKNISGGSGPFIKINDGSMVSRSGRSDTILRNESETFKTMQSSSTFPNHDNQMFMDLRLNPKANKKGSQSQQQKYDKPTRSAGAGVTSRIISELSNVPPNQQQHHHQDSMYHQQQQQQLTPQDLDAAVASSNELNPPSPYASTTLVLKQQQQQQRNAQLKAGPHQQQPKHHRHHRHHISPPSPPRSNPPKRPPPNFRSTKSMMVVDVEEDDPNRVSSTNNLSGSSCSDLNPSPTPITDTSSVHSSSTTTDGGLNTSFHSSSSTRQQQAIFDLIQRSSSRNLRGGNDHRSNVHPAGRNPTLADFHPPPPPTETPPMSIKSGGSGLPSNHQYHQLDPAWTEGGGGPLRQTAHVGKQLVDPDVPSTSAEAPRPVTPVRRRYQQRGEQRSARSSQHHRLPSSHSHQHGLEDSKTSKEHRGGQAAAIIDYETLDDLLRSFHSTNPEDKARAERFLRTHRPSANDENAEAKRGQQQRFNSLRGNKGGTSHQRKPSGSMRGLPPPAAAAAAAIINQNKVSLRTEV